MNPFNSPLARRTRHREIDFHTLNDGSDEEYDSDVVSRVKRPRNAQKQAQISQDLSLLREDDDNISPHDSASQVQASHPLSTEEKNTITARAFIALGFNTTQSDKEQHLI